MAGSTPAGDGTLNAVFDLSDVRAILETDVVRELLASPLVASLGTLNPDGTIHLVAVWFSWDGDAILIATKDGQRKVRNIERDPRVTVMIDARGGGFDICGVMLAGEAGVIREPDSRALNRGVHLRYVAEGELALAPVQGALSNEDATIQMVPRRARSWDYRHVERKLRTTRDA